MAKKAAAKTKTPARPTSAGTRAAKGRTAVDDDDGLSGWQQRALDRSLVEAKRRALTKSNGFVKAAMALLEETGGLAFTVQDVVDWSKLSLRSFYQTFASKDDLVLAFLDDRHARWMTWFDGALARHGGTPSALVPTLREWFAGADFRGCAFLNSVGELGPALPVVLEVTRRHKADMTAAIARLLAPGAGRARHARALALAVDGAIVQAQFGKSPDAALESLGVVVKALGAAVPRQ